MTLSAVAALALKVHGAVLVVAIAAYYKYGDRTSLFSRALQGNRRLRQAVRDNIAAELSRHLQPVIRDAAHTTSPVLNEAGEYIEYATDITESEAFYQAIRDYVSLSASSLLDYRLAIQSGDRWRAWAHRLSSSILTLVILETFLVTAALVAPFVVDASRVVAPWCFLASLVPTCILVIVLFGCLCTVHIKHGTLVDLRERYDS